MKKIFVILLAIMIAATGGLLVYGAILGPAETYVPMKDGLLEPPSADIYRAGKTPYEVSSLLANNATPEQIADAIINIGYNALQVKRYYFICRVDSLAGNKYFCSDYYRMLQEGQDFFYQALAYAAGMGTGARRACVGSDRLDVSTNSVSYDRSTKTFDAAFGDPEKKEGAGKPFNYYPDRAEVLFNLPIAVSDESGQVVDYSVMENCTFTVTAPSASAQYYTLNLSLNADAVNANSETLRVLSDSTSGGKMKNIRVSELKFVFTIWPCGVFRSIDVSSEFSTTISGKSANATLTRAYQFSYTPSACSIMTQIRNAGWEKFCDAAALNAIAEREASWTAAK